MLVNKVLEVDLTIPNSVKEKFLKKKWFASTSIHYSFGYAKTFNWHLFNDQNLFRMSATVILTYRSGSSERERMCFFIASRTLAF